MEGVQTKEDMLETCVQPEVILVEGISQDSEVICIDNGNRNHIPIKIEVECIPDTIPLPHLLNEGGSWQEGNFIGVQVGNNTENGQQEELAETDGFDDPDSEMGGPGQGLTEASPTLPNTTLRSSRGRPLRKRGRKGSPRKSDLVPLLPNIDKRTNFGSEAENPNIFQVALKMTMRGPDQRKPREAFMVPMSMPIAKRASLSLQDKISIIQELSTGEKQSTICKRQFLPKSTVQSIWKNREKIQGAAEKIGMNRKRCRRAQHEDVEEKLVEWINALKAQNVPVNGPQLRAKAQVMAKQMGLTEFRCSTGWLDKFKTRHHIVFKKTKANPRNVADGDRKAALDWVTKVWPALCEGYPPCDIFNVDEAGIFYRSPPDRTHRLRGETCHSGKMSEDRMTVLLCTNSDGTEKLKINAVGNISYPKSFEGIANLENLPAAWHYDSRSWITSDIFVSWLRNWDELLRSLERQIILILDSSPAHETVEQFTNIKLVFLPPGVASIIQPLEHGIVFRFKMHYRRLLLDRMVRKGEHGAHRSINVLEALTMLSTAWMEVSPELIADCFRTSNLQSLMVPDMTNGNFNSANDFNEFILDEPKYFERAIRMGIPIPENVTFKEYAMIDSSLHVTDYIQDSADHSSGCGSGEQLQREEEKVQAFELPSQRQVQDFIDGIRQWAMRSTSSCDTSVHSALSTLEAYTLRAKPPGTIPVEAMATTINVDVGAGHEIPVSVIVSSQKDSSNGGPLVDGNNLTLATFEMSQQQMVQIPISIHSQSAELVTLTALEPPSPQELDDLELVTHDHSPDAEAEENHVQRTIHFQHQQHQQQFFAYLG